MEVGRKVWYSRWSDRRNKVFYVNVESRESSWTKPHGLVETKDDLKKIAEWKLGKRKNASENTKDLFLHGDQKGSRKKKPLEEDAPPTKKLKMEPKIESVSDATVDYVQVYSDKRGLKYYYNLKTKSSQWKRPVCFQVAETEKAIENANLRKSELYAGTPVTENNLDNSKMNNDLNNDLNNSVSEDDNIRSRSFPTAKDDNILSRSSLNANAPCFEMHSKVQLNVDAAPFVPRSLDAEQFKLKALSCNDLTKSDTIIETIISPDKPKKRIKNGITRRVTVRRSDPTPTPSRKDNDIIRDRVPAKERLSLSGVKCVRNVHDRLGVRVAISPPEPFLFSSASSNVQLAEKDLIRLPYLPPHPDTEILRYSEVQTLRQLFSDLCQDTLGLEEPTEALNRWLLEENLNCTEQIDPFFAYSEVKSESLYREIMQDVPVKYKVPRQTRTCTRTLDMFSGKLLELAKTWGEENVIEEKCNSILEKNTTFSDTRTLMSELRESCRDVVERHYKAPVDQVCLQMKEQSKESARKVLESVRSAGLDRVKPSPPSSASTRLVGCRPAMPLVSDCEDGVRGAVSVSNNGTDGASSCRITYQESTLTVNWSHYTKLEKLYRIAGVSASGDDADDDDLFNRRVWCLLKRYKMLRSSMGGAKLYQENFGLHAALPHKAFELLRRKFHVTFECFASPFNCYFSQFCSAFPDIDCYFGSRGSFFDFKPKSGSFQANPPFSEEVMLAMADHMISLLEDSTEPLMFVIFIPDWREPLTPAIPRLENTIYSTHNILLSSGSHQYITGNQHLQSATHYDAVHGTRVFVLQNDSGTDTWPLQHQDMIQLRDAMSYNREWN